MLKVGAQNTSGTSSTCSHAIAYAAYDWQYTNRYQLQREHLQRLVTCRLSFLLSGTVPLGSCDFRQDCICAGQQHDEAVHRVHHARQLAHGRVHHAQDVRQHCRQCSAACAARRLCYQVLKRRERGIFD